MKMKSHAASVYRRDLGGRFVVLAILGAMIYASLFLLTSCRTTAGFGEDVQHVGQEIEEAAR